MQTKALLAVAALGTAISAYEIPTNLASIYNNHKAGDCKSAISGEMSSGTVYCGELPDAIMVKSNGGFDNMKVDCAGSSNAPAHCSTDLLGQDGTAFKDTVSTYGISDLDTTVHPYVVFGTDGFDPQDHDMKPLSVMAIVCNNQLHYGVWGDTNGHRSTGESSMSLAKLCFPDDSVDGFRSHTPMDVLYLGFRGDQAVPGKDGAMWNATTPEEFEDSIKPIGDKLVAAMPANNWVIGGSRRIGRRRL